MPPARTARTSRSSKRWAWASPTSRSESKYTNLHGNAASVAKYQRERTFRSATTPPPKRRYIMDNSKFFVDRTGAASPPLALWPSVIVPKEAIDAEIERLSALPRPADGRRRALIVHPNSTEPGLGLAPGIRVSLDVLLPGESTAPIRHNSSQVNFCIRGAGSANVAGKRFTFDRHDVWNTPSMDAYVVENKTTERQVRLTYSNAALLEKMNVHIVDENPPAEALEPAPASTHSEEKHDQNPFGTFELADGAYLMP